MSMKINHELPLPEVLKSQYPLSQELKEVKKQRDEEIRRIFTGESDKFIVLVGPCSADNEDTVCEYVRKLKTVADKVSDKLMIIPRVYTNKPRTTGDGYKGMLHQPDPDKAPDLLAGIIAIRKMHMRVMQETGLSSADEMLYPENRSYLDDILSYEAVGARSVENQQHRLTASGMDIPVGMKNPTSGDFSVMLNSVYAAQHPHSFIYTGWEVNTHGNDLAHTVLRGATNKHGANIPNYHYEDLIRLWDMYEKMDLKNPACVIDANHSNSNKQFREQIRITKEVMHSRKLSPDLHKLVKGVMIESYIEEGNQKVGAGCYGKSITDPCLGWEDSERLIYDIADRMTPDDFSGILNRGGTILGTSRQPFKKMRIPDENGLDKVEAMKSNYRKYKLDCLVVLGGNGTHKTANLLREEGLNVVTLPKTIDNDLWGTEMTFGFQSAVDIATDTIDRIHTTASSHSRVFIIEVMGHKVGHVTLQSGIAGGADVILLPEIPYDIDKVAEVVENRFAAGKKFSIIAVAEGAISKEDAKLKKKQYKAKLAERRYPSVAYEIAAALEEKTNREIRVTVPGHTQRGGAPCAYDRVLATRVGAYAAELILNKEYGYMVGIVDGDTQKVPLSEVAGNLKYVDPECQMIKDAKTIGISFGE